MNWLQPSAITDIFYASFSKKTYASLKSVRTRGGGIQESHLTPFLPHRRAKRFHLQHFDSDELNHIVMFLLT